MRSVRAFLTGAVMAGTAVLAAACGSDFSTQPTQADSSTRSMSPSPLGSQSRDIGYSAGSGFYNATVKFTINPWSDTYIQIGPHYLFIPAGAVCDPNTSGYGILTWNLQCNSATRPISVTAKASLQKDGHPLVEFDTHLRFKPSKKTEYDVMLYLYDRNADSRSTIMWCADSGSLCVDESSSAPSQQLKTRWDSNGSWVYRKIQHFSGYNSTGGREGCDTDAGCIGGDGL